MASTYLSRTLGTPTLNTKYTFSAWVKRSIPSSAHTLIGGSSSAPDTFIINSNNKLTYYANDGSSASISTTRLLRDTSAFYHLVLAVDTTQATASDRVKMYINGTLQTAFDTSTYPAQNYVNKLNSAVPHRIGQNPTYSSETFDGLMSHIHFIDGTQYQASDFGETDATTGIWKPKTAPSVTYGTNGFFLKFENSGSMGLDSSPNGNDFTVNGTLTQTVDTPSNVFATMNPLDHIKGTFFNGNTVMEAITDPGDAGCRATLGFTKGKWYWEGKINYIKGSGSSANMIGILDSSVTIPTAPNNVPNGYGFNTEGGVVYNGTTAVTSGLTTGSNGNIYGVGYDADNGNLYLWVNGVAENSGNPVATGIDTSVTWIPYFVNHYGSTNSHSWQINFGNGYFVTTAVSSATSDESGLGIFEYTVPSGYYALCTKNINEQEYD